MALTTPTLSRQYYTLLYLESQLIQKGIEYVILRDMSEDEMLNTEQVAEQFHISVATVRSLVYAGKLTRYRKVGQKYNFFKRSDVECVLDYQADESKKPRP